MNRVTKFIVFCSLAAVLASCGGGKPADKKDEPGHNPAPGQVIGDSAPNAVSVADTAGQMKMQIAAPDSISEAK